MRCWIFRPDDAWSADSTNSFGKKLHDLCQQSRVTDAVPSWMFSVHFKMITWNQLGSSSTPMFPSLSGSGGG